MKGIGLIKRLWSILFIGIFGLNLIQVQASVDQKIQCDSIFSKANDPRTFIQPDSVISRMQPWVSPKGTISENKFDREMDSYVKEFFGSSVSTSWIKTWTWKNYSEQRWQQNLLKKEAREILEDLGVQITDPLLARWKRGMMTAFQFAMSFTFSYAMKVPILFLSESKGRHHFDAQKIPAELYQKVLDHGLASVAKDLNQQLATRKEYFEYVWSIFCKSYSVAMTVIFVQMAIQTPHLALMPAEMIVSQVKNHFLPAPVISAKDEKMERAKSFEQWKSDFRISEGRDPDPIKDHDEWKRNYEYAFGIQNQRDHSSNGY